MARLRVLFVDDEPLGLEQVTRLVRKKREAWSMTFAADAATAIARLEASGFDAVVTGQLSGPCDGIALLHAIEARWPHVARVLLATRIPAAHEVGPLHAFLLVPVEDGLVCDVVDELATASHDAQRSGHALFD